MFHQRLRLAVLCLGLSFAAFDASAALLCSQIYSERPTATFTNPSRQSETLDVRAEVFLNGQRVGGSLSEAYKHPDVIKLFAEGRKFREDYETNKSRFLLEAHLPKSEGGGILRLVTLDLSRRGYIYNHPELLAILKVNPALANALGMYRPPFSSSVAWIPDTTALNVRLKQFARTHGFKDSLFYFETVDGIVPQEAFVHQIARGIWPSSGPERPDMTTHDSIHSIAFAVMGARPTARQILAVIRSRAAASFVIAQKLKAEFGEDLQKKFLDDHASGIVAGPAERSMLLVMLLSGHYDYQSVHQSWRDGTLTKQKLNRDLTQIRVRELMAHYSFGTVSFKEAIAELSVNLPADKIQRLNEIFEKARKIILVPSEKDLTKASEELMDFFSSDLFSDDVSSEGPTRPSRFYRPTVSRDVEGNQN